eukprot:3031278-Rhodomonas_salina.1
MISKEPGVGAGWRRRCWCSSSNAARDTAPGFRAGCAPARAKEGPSVREDASKRRERKRVGGGEERKA